MSVTRTTTASPPPAPAVSIPVPRQRARVLHVVDTLGVGGTEIVLANFVERSRDQFDHAVCCVRTRGPVARRLAAAGIPVHCVHKGRGRDWSVLFRIARLCRRLRPDLVHTRNWGAIEGIIGARLARVPAVVHSEHGQEFVNIAGEGYRRSIGRRLLVPWIDRLVTVSDDLRDRLLPTLGLDAKRAAVVRNGVDAVRFAPGADSARLREARGYTRTDFVVGTVGRLDPVKDHVGLLEACRRVFSHPGAATCRLVIVGDGTERETLERRIQQWDLRDRVRLAGHCDDVATWLNILDLFVLTSHMEGTSNALLEAMAIGLPVVATRVGGNPEVVRDGVTGRLVPVGDPATLAAAIEAYRRDAAARATHGAAARAWVVRHYSMDGMVNGLAAVYRDALRGPHPE